MKPGYEPRGASGGSGVGPGPAAGEALLDKSTPSDTEIAKHGDLPYITQEFHPNQGGQEATYFESEGDAGDKDIGGGLSSDQSVSTGSKDFGDYAMPRAQSLDPSVPNDALHDPECGGPPLGTTVGPNGGVDSFAKSRIGGVGGSGVDVNEPVTNRNRPRGTDSGPLGRGGSSAY